MRRLEGPVNLGVALPLITHTSISSLLIHSFLLLAR